MERVAATIPHLFYDLLARVIPGVIFLALVNLQGFQKALFGSVPDLKQANFMVALLGGLALIAAAYFSGWMLSVFSASRLKGYWGKQERGNQLRSAYYEVKLKSERTGFRILKLRAEARMLEAVQVAAVVLISLNLARSFFPTVLQPDLAGTDEHSYFSIVTLVVIWFGTQLAIGPAWHKYHSTIQTCQRLLLNEVIQESPGSNSQAPSNTSNTREPSENASV